MTTPDRAPSVTPALYIYYCERCGYERTTPEMATTEQLCPRCRNTDNRVQELRRRASVASDPLVSEAQRIAEAIKYDEDGFGMPTPRPLLLALARRIETLTARSEQAERERDEGRAYAVEMEEWLDEALTALGVKDVFEMRERFGKPAPTFSKGNDAQSGKHAYRASVGEEPGQNIACWDCDQPPEHRVHAQSGEQR